MGVEWFQLVQNLNGSLMSCEVALSLSVLVDVVDEDIGDFMEW